MMKCREQKWVDAHFKGALHPGDEHRMRAHLPDCPACRAYYDKRLTFEQIDPRALHTKARLERGLGLTPRGSSKGLFVGVPAIFAMAGLAFMLTVGSPSDQGYTARGGSPPSRALPSNELEIYRLQAGHAVRVDQAITTTDELAFAYRNGARKRRLLLFGANEKGQIQWYHPSWSDADENPVAVPITDDANTHELPEAIAQAVRGSSLRVTAWFVDDPVSVRDAEALFGQNKAPVGAIVVTKSVRVDSDALR